MFQVIGQDGIQYTATDLAELRLWLAQGRLSADTLVRRAEDNQWRRLAELLAAEPLPLASPAKTNSLAVAGLVLGALSITGGLCCGGPLLAVAGIVCSAIGLSQIKADPQSQGGRGLALAGLWLSIGGLVFSLVMMFFWMSFGLLGGMLQ